MSKQPRIDVVDALRGFAVCGIIMIHFIEHLNFYAFPDPTPLDQAVWDVVFFLGSGKMYAIFSLLFGLSCFIQHRNQEKLGHDFRGRFAWRMLLLFLWGILDLVFYNGDILCTYAVLGLLLIPLVKASDRALLAAAAFLLLQPVELSCIVLGLFNPGTAPMDVGLGPLWGRLYGACAEGSFLDVARTNLSCGLRINFGWALENGRLTQTLMLFIVGMYLGRKRLFLDEGDNMGFWRKALVGSAAATALLLLLGKIVPGMAGAPAVRHGLETMLKAWQNFSMMSLYVSGLVLLYYRTGLRGGLSNLSVIGRMSLSAYLLQSVVGGFLFYNWGLGLYRFCGHAVSFLLSLLFLVVLYFLCRAWSKGHRRGPLEQLWSVATFVGSGKR